MFACGDGLGTSRTEVGDFAAAAVLTVVECSVCKKVKTSRCVRVIAERTTAAVSELYLMRTPMAELS